jgi:hypothetical protein
MFCFPKPPTMATLEIPTRPPITENNTASSHIQKWKACHAVPIKKPQYGSYEYDCEKGKMTYKWGSEAKFGEWLAAEESKNSIELVVSQVFQSDSPVWWERCVLRCTREHTGGQQACKNVGQLERKILLKKTGCWCCLTIKQYPDMEKIRGKYEDQHNHKIGEENLQFTRLLDPTKDFVMDMVHMEIDPKVIMRGHSIFDFSAHQGWSRN